MHVLCASSVVQIPPIVTGTWYARSACMPSLLYSTVARNISERNRGSRRARKGQYAALRVFVVVL